MSDSFRPNGGRGGERRRNERAVYVPPTRSREGSGGAGGAFTANPRFKGRLGSPANQAGHDDRDRPHDDRRSSERGHQDRYNQSRGRGRDRYDNDRYNNHNDRSYDRRPPPPRGEYGSRARGDPGGHSRGRRPSTGFGRQDSRGRSDRGVFSPRGRSSRGRGRSRGGYFENRGPRPVPTQEVLMQFLAKRYDATPASGVPVLDLSDVYSDEFWNTNQPRLNLNYKEDVQALATLLADKLPTLQCLSISKNRLRYLNQFEPIVQAVPSMQYLSMEENSVENALDVATTFGRWQHLKGIMIQHNPFSRNLSLAAIGGKFKSSGRFPVLETIDNQPIPESIGFDLNNAAAAPQDKLLPERKAVGIADEDADDIKPAVEGFLTDFVQEFDNPTSREGLSKYYHDRAAFSLVTQGVKRHEQGPENDISHLFGMSRKLNFSGRNSASIKHGRSAVVSMSTELPNTKHLLDTLVFDVGYKSEELLHLSYSGELYEEGKTQGQFFTRDFSRSLTVVPCPENPPNQHSLVITNDILVLRAKPVKRPDQHQSAQQVPAQNQPQNPVDEMAEILRRANAQPAEPSLDDKTKMSSKFASETGCTLQEAYKLLKEYGNWNYEHTQMVVQFMKDSGMKAEFCRDCLHSKNWDYTQAGQYYLEMDQAGKITAEMRR